MSTATSTFNVELCVCVGGLYTLLRLAVHYKTPPHPRPQRVKCISSSPRSKHHTFVFSFPPSLMLLSAAKTQQQQSPPGPGLHSHPVNALRGDSLRGVGPGEEDAHARQRNVRPFRHKHFGLLAATGCCGDGGWGGGGGGGVGGGVGGGIRSRGGCSCGRRPCNSKSERQEFM